MAESLGMVGQRFDRLLIMSRAENRRDGTHQWLCRCDCGASIKVRRYDLIHKTVRSCGCLRRDRGIANSSHLAELRKRIDHSKQMVHGRSKTPTYFVWKEMTQRCTNPNDEAYRHYGGRGITICARWKGFENFLADMGERPNGLTLDRFPNNNGNYEPGNCRWATAKQQANNTRNNRLITFDGRTRTLAEWSDLLGLSQRTLWQRLQHWPIEKALTQPLRPQRRA